MIGAFLDALAWLKRRIDPQWAAASIAVAALIALLSLNDGMSPRQSFATALVNPVPYLGDSRSSVLLARAVEKATKPGAKIAVCFAGATPYFAERDFIDLLGKCDERIARSPSHLRPGASIWTAFWPGHSKWDLAYSLGELRPDAVTKLTGPLGQSPDGGLLARDYDRVFVDGFPLFLRKGSPRLAP